MTQLPISRSGKIADTALVDGFGRPVTYLRLSVTDRCDLRCTYCMPEHQRFMSRREQLSLAELDDLATTFIGLGVRKLRLTGGEPLVRKGILDLIGGLSRHLANGALDEIVLSTNGTHLAEVAADLHAAGVRRVNVSLDTLDPDAYRRLTRGGDIAKVLRGIDAARRAGLAVRLNAVAIRGVIEADLDQLIRFAHARDCALVLIETMPLGDTGVSRLDQFVSLADLRRDLERRWTLEDASSKSGGPARFTRIVETGGLLGFITPLSCNFCTACNRVRVSSAGRLYTCLGSDSWTDLRGPLRGEAGDLAVEDAIRRAIAAKPERHSFEVSAAGVVGIGRHMSVLGG